MTMHSDHHVHDMTHNAMWQAVGATVALFALGIVALWFFAA